MNNFLRPYTTILIVILLLSVACTGAGKPEGDTDLLVRAEATFDSVRVHMATDDNVLLQEAVPPRPKQHAYSYLWGYSAMVSAVNALHGATGSDKWSGVMEDMMLKGLDKYYDSKRKPAAYSSYVNTAKKEDRFYDDNIWVGIDMADMYARTGDEEYLRRAEEIWTFVMSGCDDVLGGGIYWCEQKKRSKNTCSNAPAAVFALKMYGAVGDSMYLEHGTALYAWTKENLEDTTDNVMFDNIGIDGRIGRAKYSYNTGQMIQAAALLYKITGEQHYLDEAGLMAEGAYNAFFRDKGRSDGLRILKGGELWFDAVMLRGYIELYSIDGNSKYIDAFKASVEEAWQPGSSRDGQGLFGNRYDRPTRERTRTLLNQAAMIEIMARIAATK